MTHASSIWLVSFVGKLVVLARVMRLRVSRAASLLTTCAGLGLVVVPRLVQRLDAHDGSVLVALWLYAIVSLGVWVAPRIVSTEPLDDWGRLVLRRSLRATWAIWAALLLLHTAF